jgi:hypothetical protein
VPVLLTVFAGRASYAQDEKPCLKYVESFRYGVLYHDKAHLDAVLQYPVTVWINKTLGAEKPDVIGALEGVRFTGG